MLVEEAGAGSRRSRGEVGVFRVLWVSGGGRRGVRGWSRAGCRLAAGGILAVLNRMAAGMRGGGGRARRRLFLLISRRAVHNPARKFDPGGRCRLFPLITEEPGKPGLLRGGR